MSRVDSSDDRSGEYDARGVGLTGEQYAVFRQKFSELDRNGDGVVDAGELRALALAVGGQDEAASVNEMLETADINKDGKIDFHEFASVLKTAQDNKYRVIYEVFNMMDKDGNGYITEDELEHWMGFLGRDKYAKSRKQDQIGMIDYAQLRAKGVSRDYVEAAVASPDDALRVTLLNKLNSKDRGIMSLEEFAHELGYYGNCVDLERLTSDDGYSGYSTSGRQKSSHSRSRSRSGTGTGTLTLSKSATASKSGTASATASTSTSVAAAGSGSMAASGGTTSSSSASTLGEPGSAKKRGFLQRLRGAAKGEMTIKEYYLGRSFNIRCPNDASVGDLYAKVAKRVKRPADQIRLYHHGFELTNQKARLNQLHIKERCTLNLLYHPNPDLLRAAHRPGHINLVAMDNHFLSEGRLEPSFALFIIRSAKDILEKQPNVLELSAPINVCGDIHGQYYDLRNIFKHGGFLGTTPYVFMGDYVDRGYFSCECALLVLAALVKYPKKVFLLRGNHESLAQTSKIESGTRDEFEHKYNSEIYDALIDCFNVMPPAAVVTSHGKRFFLAHGGIPREYDSIDEMKDVDRFGDPEAEGKGAFKGLLWNDPGNDCIASSPHPASPSWDLDAIEDKGKPDVHGSDYAGRHFGPNDRGPKTYTFDYMSLNHFLAKNDLVSVLRGHEQKPGYELGKEGTRYKFPCILTVFSAPNYTDTNLATGGMAIFDSHGNLTLKEYTWNEHPVYHTGLHETKAFEKHYLMEDYVQYLAYSEPRVLSRVSLTHILALPAAQTFIQKMNARGKVIRYADLHSDTRDWLFLTDNLLTILRESGDPAVRALARRREREQREQGWQTNFDFFADAIVREAENEKEFTVDDDEEFFRARERQAKSFKAPPGVMKKVGCCGRLRGSA